MYEYINDDILKEINETLDWHSGIELPDGRILGSLTKSKRDKPETIPDKRIVRLHETLDLNGKSVLEVGCLEGAHTLSFLQYTDDVTAFDVRPKNVINTLMRLSVMGKKANVFVAEAEKVHLRRRFDVMFHCGVFYHLIDPVNYMRKLEMAAKYILLDTHIAKQEESSVFPIWEKQFSGHFIPENNWESPFAGKDEYAMWLTEDSLRKLIDESGYDIHEEWEHSTQRNGERICWLLKSKMEP